MIVRATAFLLVCAAIPLGAAAQAGAADAEARLQAHLAAAKTAQAHTDCHTAAQEFHEASLLMPQSGELRTNEGIALYCDRQFPAAVTTLESALRLNHELAVPHLFLGLADFRLGHTRQASQHLGTYLQHAPDDVTAHLWLGYTLAAQQDPAAACAEFQQVLVRDPANLDARYALGEADLALAHQTALQLQAADPGGSSLLHLAAARYQLTGDQARADAALQQAQAQEASRPAPADSEKISLLLAEAQTQQKDALAAFATVLETSPDSYRAHEVMADALVAAQQQPAAIAEYEQVIHLNPELPGIHEALSQCLMTAGRFADAQSALTAELAISPAAAARLETRIGQTRLAIGDDTGAAQVLEQAVTAPEVPAQAYLLLGQVRLRQGRAADAVPQLKRYIAADPGNETTFYYLSRAYRTLGDKAAMTQALADYQRVAGDAHARALTKPITAGSPAESFAELAPPPGPAADAAHATPKAQ